MTTDSEQKLTLKELLSSNPTDYLEHKLVFPVHDLIGRQVGSLEGLKQVLKEEPAEAVPDILDNSQPWVAEFVSIEKIVGGGVGKIDWSVISKAEGRGIERVWAIIQAIQKGNIDLTGIGDQLKVKEINGKYYVSQGRGRVAALKALKIPFYPMYVKH